MESIINKFQAISEHNQKMKNSRKKILFNVSGSGILSSNKGGAIEKIVANQINYLSEEFEIIVFGQLSPLNENVKVIPYNRRMYLNKKFILNDILFLIYGFWKMCKIEVDIIVPTHQRNLFLSLLYAKIKRKPLIAWELDHIIWMPPLTKIKRFYHYLIKKSDCVITESLEQKRRMIKQGIDQNKIRVVYGTINTTKYHPLNRELNKNYILYVAKFTERKNQLLLLKAFSKTILKYNDLKLILVGPTSGAFTGIKNIASEYYTQCSNYIKSNRLEDKVIFYENVEEDKLIKLYQESTLFVFPSLEEGFGITLLEAMSCGCPCISNNIEPLSEVLGQAGVLIDVLDANALSEKIIDLLNKSKLRRELSKLARERAISLFGSDKIHKQFKEILVRHL